MSKVTKASNTEKIFLEALWKADEPLSLQDFIRIFQEKDWQQQTISTFLARLVKKGYVIAFRKGRAFYYQPAISKTEYNQTLINQTLGQFYGLPIEEIIAAFCGNENPDNEDIKKIREWLDDMTR